MRWLAQVRPLNLDLQEAFASGLRRNDNAIRSAATNRRNLAGDFAKDASVRPKLATKLGHPTEIAVLIMSLKTRRQTQLPPLAAATARRSDRERGRGCRGNRSYASHTTAGHASGRRKIHQPPPNDDEPTRCPSRSGRNTNGRGGLAERLDCGLPFVGAQQGHSERVQVKSRRPLVPFHGSLSCQQNILLRKRRIVGKRGHAHHKVLYPRCLLPTRSPQYAGSKFPVFFGAVRH
jgi:hypothetical protein